MVLIKGFKFLSKTCSSPKDSDIINIHTEWLPFNNFSEYIDKTDNLKKQIATLQTENENKSNLIKKLEDEIKLLKAQQTNH